MKDLPALRPLPVGRDDLVKMARLAFAVIDDEDQPASVRRLANEVADRCDFLLIFDQPSERDFRLLPTGFAWPGYYQKLLEDIIKELPDEVRQEMPAQCIMAEKAAALCDRHGASEDFRLDALDVLNSVLADLTGRDTEEAAAELEGVQL